MIQAFVLGVAASLAATVIVLMGRAWWRRRQIQRAFVAEMVQLPPPTVWTVVLGSRLPAERPQRCHTHVVRKWLEDLGAVEFREVLTRVRLRGVSSTDVLITNVSAHIVQCQPPLAATRVECPDAGTQERMVLYFDLQESPSNPVQQAGDGYDTQRSAEPYFRSHYLVLRRGEVLEVDLIAASPGPYFRFYWEVTFIASNRSITRRVGDTAVLEVSGPPPSGFTDDLVWAWYEGGRLVAADDPELLVEDP